MRSWKKWILPGLLTVGILTGASVLFQADAIEGDLSDKAVKELKGPHPWASISLDGRDLTLSGTAPTQEALDQAIKIANEAYDVRVVNNTSDLLPVVSPYIFGAKKADGKIKLTGNAPDIQTRRALNDAAKKVDRSAQIEDQTALAAGARDGFSELAGFSVSLLKDLDKGELIITGNALEISGVANTSSSYEKVLEKLSGELPGDGSLASNTLLAPMADPFEWKAQYDGKEATLSGFATSRLKIEEFQEALKSTLPDTRIFNRMRIASGAPSGFSGVVSTMLKLFSNLEKGQLSISGRKINIDGIAKSADDYQSYKQKLEQLPQGFEIANADVPPIEVSTTEQQADNEAGVEQEASGNATEVEITSSGVIASPEAGNERANEESDNTSNVSDAQSENSSLPLANPYRWSVSKVPGGVTVLGNASDQATADAATEMVKQTLGVSKLVDRQVLASGAPEGFDEVRKFVTRQLRLLEAGQGNIIGTRVSVTGRARNQNLRNLIDRVVTSNLPDGFTGTTNIVFPKSEAVKAKPVEVLPPIAKPFRWRISKLPDGVTVAGNTASGENKKTVSELVTSTLGVAEFKDEQTIARGKPSGFDAAQALLVRQVKLLETGQGSITDKKVEITGQIKNRNLVNLIKRALENKLPQGFTGQANISAPETEVVKAGNVEFVSNQAKACQENIINAIDGRKIQFETNRAIIKSQSQSVLGDITKVALECPQVRFEIGGHTDSRGRENYNQELSEARAEAVVDYLVKAGVAPGRLEAKGYGEGKPIADNETAEGRGFNRRIEFKVIR